MPASNPSAPFFAGTSIARTLEHFCVESHGLLVSTPDLATEYSRFNQRTYVCYNAIDDRQAERFVRPLKSGAKREGQVRIGYAGSDTHAGDFAMILPALCRLMITRPKVRLVFIGANQRNLIPERFWGQTEFLGGTGSAADLPFDDPRADATTERRLGSVSYYDVVQAADFDIGIAPIAPVTFNRCKSYLKVMEYGMLGIPAVATRYGPYLQYQAEAKEPVVRLVDSPDAWEQVLQEMVDDAEMRVTLAGANHAYVHRAHLMSRRVRAWEDTLLAATACRDTAA
jgi:glycosyltransferase involved in cell wall biosynthesis